MRLAYFYFKDVVWSIEFTYKSAVVRNLEWISLPSYLVFPHHVTKLRITGDVVYVRTKNNILNDLLFSGLGKVWRFQILKSVGCLLGNLQLGFISWLTHLALNEKLLWCSYLVFRGAHMVSVTAGHMELIILRKNFQPSDAEVYLP